jgi:hypothetical protein
MSTNFINYSSEIEKFYFSPVLNLGYGIHTTQDYLNLYVFLGRTEIPDESIDPPEIILTPTKTKDILKNVIALKKANLNDISPVIQRIDWAANTFYYSYNGDENQGIKGVDNKLIKPFYVRNRYDQVFKCLWNNITSYDSYEISNIANNSTYYTITHQGGTFDVGSLITIGNVNPTDYNGTFKIVASSIGSANVICSFQEQYSMSANNYQSGGFIKQTALTAEEPFLTTGTYSEDNIIKTSDGYKWKYLYTLDKGAKLKFFDTDWMPVQIKNLAKYPYSSNVGWGSIDVVNVINGGNGYTNGTNTVSILISGDGSEFSAEAFVSNNVIQDITVLNKGYDYTYANVSIIPETGYSGFGAELDFSVSPIGGHGFNLLEELYCKDVCTSVPFNKTDFYDDFYFNQVGILYNPYISTDIVNHSNSSFISCTTDMVVTSLGNPFIEGEIVYQGNSVDEFEFKATVLLFDSSNNYLSLINTFGTPKENFELFGTTSSAVKIIRQVFPSLYIPNSGNIFYVENRLDELNDVDSNKQVRILINYKQ